eukprot:60871-Pyramimonas_sp.AAC.1
MGSRVVESWVTWKEEVLRGVLRGQFFFFRSRSFSGRAGLQVSVVWFLSGAPPWSSGGCFYILGRPGLTEGK